MDPANERPGAHRASRNTIAAAKLPDARRWRRTVNGLTDDELMAVVRGMVAVDKAVESFRGRTP